ncbi:S-type pyocin domain-containing protein [Streptomyces sp. NPDC004610]|uniref:S-type pyocin domain-containing protein n=1 Tax=unclassified Streptomyces TaxID=2593676 RepID=UPI0033A12A9C
MRAENSDEVGKVIPFLPFLQDHPVPNTEQEPSGAPHQEASAEASPDAAAEPAVHGPLVLNAERGIINTGTVHGGQHHTTVEQPRPPSHRGRR